jgi:site-specific DNA-methyltransferase (adenine-specific)
MIQKIAIDLIKENPNNPRTIKDGKFKKLVKSIKDFPRMLEIRPIVVNEDFTVLGGNMRLKACKAAGLEQVHIIKVDDLSPEQQKEFVIKDNSGYGEWDWDLLLTDEWGYEKVEDWGIDFPDAKKPKPEAKEDAFKMPNKVTTTIKQGDLIEIGPHRLLCGSATDASDMDKLMQGQGADLSFTDPPYNVDYEGGTGLKIMNDKMSDSNFIIFLQDAFANMHKHLKPGGGFYIWHAVMTSLDFLTALKNTAGLKFSQIVYWEKSTFVFARQDYHWILEPAIYGWKEGQAHTWYGDRKQSTLKSENLKSLDKWTKDELVNFAKAALEERSHTEKIKVDKPLKNAEHPTMKPILLCSYYIQNSSKEKDIVLDQFLGSGSTMVASHQLNRVCYGTELDPQYCQVIVDRMRALDPELVIKINSNPI